MLRTIFYSSKLVALILLLMSNLYANALTIIPLKKPILDKITEQEKITQGVIRPKSKPIKKIENKQVSKEIIIPVSKSSKKIKKSIAKTVEKKIQKNNSIIPRNKPLIVNQSSRAKKTR